MLKVPSNDSDFESSWREELVAVVTKYRIMDANLREPFNNKRIFICQKHFKTDQYHFQTHVKH